MFGRSRPSFRVPRSEFRVRRPGFTLLEVILTLLISGLVVAAIAAAINIHLRVVESGRAEVEQAQLARSLLRRIADDLRSAVPVAKQESGTASTEELDALASAAAGAAGSSGGSGSSSGSGGGGSGGGRSSGGSSGSSSSGSSGKSSSSSGGGSSSSGSGSSSSSAAESTATDDTVVQPNFYGTQYQLQFDVGRLPDAQQFSAMSSDAAMSGAAQAADTLSDVKTVAYFLGASSNPAAAVDPFATVTAATTNGGLMRTEMSRAASSFAYSQGGSSTPTGERVLAPEVVTLQFQYYDGTQWLTDWDTSTIQTLPLCVEVLLTLRTNSPGTTTDPLALLTASSDVIEKSYRLLVHLPGSTVASGTSATTTDSSTTESEATQ